MIPGGEWMHDGLCAQIDPELWFPMNDRGNARAKRLCGLCPVLAECRTWALTHEHEAIHGVLAGMDRRERVMLRLRRAAA